ncbi:MAG: VWA domain-containing protein [Flavobacteriales bacterium]|nr:MAG: VWA domain-containing protein [Flavobacteriales bacterium]
MRVDREFWVLLGWLLAACAAVVGVAVYLYPRFEWASLRAGWAAVGLIMVMAWWLFRRNRRRPAVYLSTMPALNVSGGGALPYLRHLPPALSVVGLGLFILALARPQLQNSWQDETVDGIDIIIAMDFSASMLARDLKPDRLSAAKNVGMRFIDDRPNDRMGLVVYEGEAYTQCPLTTDHQVLKDLFAQAKSGNIEGGTAVGMGLATAVNRLRDSDAKSKVVILLTDGVNNAGSVQPLDAAQIARQYGVRVYTIGVGSRGKALSPVAVRPDGTYHYDMVPVEIDERSLEGIAEATGGKCFRATDERKLAAVYSEIDRMEKNRRKVTEHSRRSEEYAPLLLWGCGLLLGALLLDLTLLRSMP